LLKTKKEIELQIGKKKANYYYNQHLKIARNENKQNNYKQEMLLQIQNQLSLIFGSIPNL
jgi:hypothetical protein